MGDISLGGGTRFRGIAAAAAGGGRRAGLGSKDIGRKPSFSSSSDMEDILERRPSL
jgi:hypothetical protein